MIRIASLSALSLALVFGGTAFAQPSSAEPSIFKSPTRTFGSHFAFTLDEQGRIWTKALKGEGRWVLLGGTGLPFGEETLDPEVRIREIHADSTGLLAIGSNGRVFDAEIDDAVAGQIHWNFRWGNPWRIGAGPQFLPSVPLRAMSYSLLNPEGFYQEDRAGNPHTIQRIDTLWLLEADGRALRFDDPWLPPNRFDFRISSPNRGAVELVSFSASGSTLFATDAQGHLFTRMIDFDTMGGNPGITYSFTPANHGYAPTGFWAVMRGLAPMLFDVRTLPAEDWKAQPRPPGEITRRLTIVQTGQGNAARELRIEGRDAQGRTGYFVKPILAPEWSFVATGAVLEGALLVANQGAQPAPTRPETLFGYARFGADGQRRRTLRATVIGVNHFHDPMRVLIDLGKGQTLAFQLFTRPDPWPWDPRWPRRLRAGLVVDERSLQSPRAKVAWTTLFGGRQACDVWVMSSPDRLVFEPVPRVRRTVPFRFELSRPTD